MLRNNGTSSRTPREWKTDLGRGLMVTSESLRRADASPAAAHGSGPCYHIVAGEFSSLLKSATSPGAADRGGRRRPLVPGLQKP